MYASTLEILGLSPASTDGEISARLHSPRAGTLARAWDNEIAERTKENGGNRDAGWRSSQMLEAALWEAYLADCDTRNQDQLKRQRQSENEVRTGNVGEDTVIPRIALAHFISRCPAAELEEFRQMLAACPRTAVWLK